MPEPAEQGDQGSQVEQIANTPQEAADQPTIAKQSDKAPSIPPGMMDYLDIPPELQARLAPKAEEPKAETPPESPTEAAEEVPKEQPEAAEADEEEEEVEAEELAPVAEQKVDKRQKRINRLTRQKNDLERQVDHIISENQKLRQELEKGQAKAPAVQPPGLTGGRLADIQVELDKCDAMLAWCDENPEGGQIGEGDNAKYYDSATVRAWRRGAETSRQEKVVEKREELWTLEQSRKQSNSDAFQLWPEMFDKRTPEFQEAVSIIRQYPFLQALPEANLVVGTFLEGRKKLREKLASKNGEPQKAHRDIDERAFSTPRVPIAPHTPEPPSREAAPSSTKRYNDAMSNLIKDVDGGSGSVAAVFAAQDQVSKQQAPGRSQVRK